MSKLWKAPAIALLAILTLAPLASAQQQRVIIVRRYYTYPVYDPFYWDRYGFYHPRYVQPTTGEVKLKTDMKTASVYVDGGYAGTAGKLKHFSLPPGTHQVELRDSEGVVIAERNVQVLLGKTITLDLRG
jgi:PEGA domain-containing protein